jgi:hypothetical protein
VSPFSERQGFVLPKGIRYRDELPYELRSPIIDLARKRTGIRWLCKIVSGELDPYGLEAYLPSKLPPLQPSASFNDLNLRTIHEYIAGCPWFRVYDVIEVISQALSLPVQEDDRIVTDHASRFETEINEYFSCAEIGWQLRNGLITTRGDDAFESTISAAVNILEEAQRPTASGHIRSAITALSSRPKANTSGAVAHATNAVECVLGEITGETMTLTDYLKKYPRLFHPCLKKGGRRSV